MRHGRDSSNNSILAGEAGPPADWSWGFMRKNPLRVTLVFSIYGVLFELFLGGLVGAPILIAAILAPYVGMGYAFVSMLPLSVLMKRKDRGPDVR
ncbi:MAG TPA: hypothetical protein VNA15_06995 [Candidatus Angelobacter sp.]|nr:hypothetical protein [Candidatus Angelobacter sp.]